MSISQRSKSAPQLAILALPKAGAGGRYYTSPGLKVRKQKSLIYGHPSPLVTPAVLEKEDPFSLSGFFPSSMEDEQQWSWLRMESNGEESEDGESEMDASFPATPAVELDADKVIRGEDKMGILALSHLLENVNTDGIAAHTMQLLLPYAGDDAVDSSDSLYDTFRARRLAHEGAHMKEILTTTTKTETMGLSLFSPVEEEEDKGQAMGWRSVVIGMFV